VKAPSLIELRVEMMNTRMLSILAFFIITIVLVDVAIMFIQYNSSRANEISQLLQNYQSLFQNYTSLNQSFANSLEEIKSLTSQLLAMNSTYLSSREQCNQTIANLTQVISSLQAENSNLKGNLSYCSSLQNNLTNAQQQILLLQSNLSKLISDYEALNMSYSQLLNSCQAGNLSSMVAQLNSALSAISSNLSSISSYSEMRGSLTPYSSAYVDYNSPVVVNAVKGLFGSSKENPYVALYKIYNFIKSNITLNFDTPYLRIEYNSTDNSIRYSEDSFYLRSASEVLSLGMGDEKDEAILAAAMYEAFYVNYWGSPPQIYAVIINGTGPHGSRYHGFLLVLYGSGKASLIDPAAAQLLGQDYQELVQAEPTGIYSAVTSYLSRISSFGSWSGVVGMIGADRVYILNNMDFTSFISFLYSIGG